MLGDSPILRRVALYVLALALFLIPLRLLSRSLTFFPDRVDSASLSARAEAYGLKPWLDHQGTRIGWIKHSPNSPSSLLIFHGNAGSAIDRAYLAEFLQLLDPPNAPDIFILEYPGYGDRPGHPSEESFTAAALAALKLFPPDSPPLILGESIGSGVAAQVAARAPEKICGLILLTPFTSLTAVGQHHYPWLPVRWLLADQFESQKALRNYSGPISFIVAGEDEVTPTALGLELFNSYSGPKKLFTVPRAAHNDAAINLPGASWQQALNFASGQFRP